MYRLQSITRRTATNCVRAPDNLAYLLTKTNTESFRRTRAPAATIASRGRIIRRVLSDVPQATPVNSSRRPGPPPARTADAPPPRRLIVEIRRTTASERVSERGRSRPPRAAGRAASPRPAASCCPSHGPRAEEAFLLPRRPTDRPSTKVSICCALADERDRFCRFFRPHRRHAVLRRGLFLRYARVDVRTAHWRLRRGCAI